MDEKKIATEELIKQVTAASQVAAVEKEAARQSLKKKPRSLEASLSRLWPWQAEDRSTASARL